MSWKGRCLQDQGEETEPQGVEVGTVERWMGENRESLCRPGRGEVKGERGGKGEIERRAEENAE